MLLEVCVDSPDGLRAAVEGGADRVELCCALALGGLTPTIAIMQAAARAGIPAVAMIRPRPGDFVWSKADIDHMQAEIEAAQAQGVAGIVIGANRTDGALDDRVLRKLLCGLQPGVQKVLHRAIDLTPDPVAAVEIAISLGFDRILSSGGAARAADGIDVLCAMQDRGGARITIMPGSGVTAGNVGALLERLPVTEIHASCAGDLPQDERAVLLGFTGPVRRETDARHVRDLRQALDSHA
jgi:copper homeostasis protein